MDRGIAVSTTAYSHGTDSDLRLREALNPTRCVLGFVVMTLLGNGCSKNKANTSYLSWSTLTQKPISSVLLLTVSFYRFILIYTHTKAFVQVNSRQKAVRNLMVLAMSTRNEAKKYVTVLQ